MKLKLIRLANVFNRSDYPSFMIFFAVTAISVICSNFQLVSICCGLVLLLIYFFLSTLNSTKYIELDQNRIRYVSRENLPSGAGKFICVKVTYQVTDIAKFTLEQGKIERLFGLAHIVFIGKTTLDAGKYTDRFPPKVVHCLYGIRYNKCKDFLSLYSKHLNLPSQEPSFQ